MLVLYMEITACGIGLPDFHQRLWHRTAIAIKHPAGDDNAFALWFLFMLSGKVVIGFADFSMSVDRASNFRQGVRKINERLRW